MKLVLFFLALAISFSLYSCGVAPCVPNDPRCFSTATGGSSTQTENATGGQTPDTLAAGGSVGTADRKRVFVTSSVYSGDLKTAGHGRDGLEGGDNLCQLAAESVNLGGRWVAWLSSDTVDAIDRVTQVTDGYYLLPPKASGDQSSMKFANNKANLATVPLRTISIDEQGNDVNYANTSIYVWTGTSNGGRKSASHCKGFTSSSDFSTRGYLRDVSRWTLDSPATSSCSSQYHLYCFEK